MPRPAVVIGDAPDTAGSPWLVPAAEPTEPADLTDPTDVDESNPGGSSGTV